MKRTPRTLFPFFLLLLMLLTGCGKEKTAYGSVVKVEAAPDAVILADEKGKETAFLIGESTSVLSWTAGERDVALREGMKLRINYSGRRSSYTSPNGRKYPCYTAGIISVEEVPGDAPVILSDGTRVWQWKGIFYDSYQLEDGTVLLGVDMPRWQEWLQGTSAEAHQAIENYFWDQGAVVDIGQVLEDVYRCYLAQEDKAEFQQRMVWQETSFTAESSRVLYFCNSVLTPLVNGLDGQYNLGVAFDRETGEVIPMEDLFTCGKDEIMPAICAASKLDDEELLADMENAFQTEYLNFWPENLEVWFPEGTLPSHSTAFILSVDMADMESILEPWAVPVSQE